MPTIRNVPGRRPVSIRLVSARVYPDPLRRVIPNTDKRARLFFCIDFAVNYLSDFPYQPGH